MIHFPHAQLDDGTMPRVVANARERAVDLPAISFEHLQEAPPTLTSNPVMPSRRLLVRLASRIASISRIVSVLLMVEM
nr:hypothetical protein [Sphingomicrobium sp. B8]